MKPTTSIFSMFSMFGVSAIAFALTAAPGCAEEQDPAEAACEAWCDAIGEHGCLELSATEAMLEANSGCVNLCMMTEGGPNGDCADAADDCGELEECWND